MPGGLHPPLELVLAWQTDAFPHGERRDPTLVVVIAVMFFVTVAVVAGRMYARMIVQHNAGLDDALILAAMLPTTGLAISIFLADTKFGFDRHIWDLSTDMAVKGRQITLAITECYILSTGLTKISILCFYRRMGTGTVDRWFRWLVYASIAFVVAYMVTFTVALFVGCRPLNSYWNQANFEWLSANEGKWECYDEGASILTASAISIVQDFLACGLPLLLFRKLQIPRRQKIALGAVFGVGLFLCITGILRIVYIHALFYTTYDVPWAAGPVWIWTGVEAHVGIICASAPALKLFFRTLLAVSGYSGSGSRISGSGGRHGGKKYYKPGNTSFKCVGPGASGIGSFKKSKAFELDSFGGGGKQGEFDEETAFGAFGGAFGGDRKGAGGGGLGRFGSLRGMNSARVERGSGWIPPTQTEMSEGGARGGGGGSNGWPGFGDPEMGIKVAHRVDVTVTARAEEDEKWFGKSSSEGWLDDGGPGAGGRGGTVTASARSSSETKLVKGGPPLGRTRSR